MRKLVSVVLCLCICACLSSCSSTDDRSESIGEYERGWDDGYSLGYYDGYEEGTKSGGDEDSYEDGYNEGYQAGATYACIFYDDVDRAFRSAYKGSAWHTFIDAYDQYISNIYDDDETRSQLFWAFVSVKSGDGLTTEERDLLISTFGEGLFIRNDIDLQIE